MEVSIPNVQVITLSYCIVEGLVLGRPRPLGLVLGRPRPPGLVLGCSRPPGLVLGCPRPPGLVLGCPRPLGSSKCALYAGRDSRRCDNVSWGSCASSEGMLTND